jgi:hypothetical protein
MISSLRKQLLARLATFGVDEQPIPGRDDGFARVRVAAMRFSTGVTEPYRCGAASR